MAKKKRKKSFRLFIKTFLCLIYLLISFVLVVSAYRLHLKDKEIIKWSEVKTTNQYSYLEIIQMSEPFAVIKNEDKQIHFVREQEDNGSWHTYLVAIKKEDYGKYKKLIDYTYERTSDEVEPIKLYGYPIKISDSIKNLAIKNIENFVPIENKVVLTEKNFEKYLTDTYLDTTKGQKHDLDYIVIILLVMTFILLVLIVVTILDKDKIVDGVDNLIEKELDERYKNKILEENKAILRQEKEIRKKAVTKEKIEDEEDIEII